MIATNENLKEQNKFDVTILGGGLAGLTLARQLLMKHPELKLSLIHI